MPVLPELGVSRRSHSHGSTGRPASGGPCEPVGASPFGFKPPMRPGPMVERPSGSAIRPSDHLTAKYPIFIATGSYRGRWAGRRHRATCAPARRQGRHRRHPNMRREAFSLGQSRSGVSRDRGIGKLRLINPMAADRASARTASPCTHLGLGAPAHRTPAPRRTIQSAHRPIARAWTRTSGEGALLHPGSRNDRMSTKDGVRPRGSGSLMRLGIGTGERFRQSSKPMPRPRRGRASRQGEVT